jgi:hypothetical protein
MKSTTTIITIDDTMIVIPSNDYSGKSGWVWHLSRGKNRGWQSKLEC